jgi:hypothetical protein
MISPARIAIAVSLTLGVAMLPAPQPVAHAASATAVAMPGNDVDPRPVHTLEDFAFGVDLPVDRALPLFGAVRERDWAPGWSPEVRWPAPAVDREGMVFSVAHGDRTAIWVNTALDPVARRVQYVYVIPEVVATVITVRLTPHDGGTHVAVRYERTALTTRANPIVEHMAASDRSAGPVWEQQIRQYLSGAKE